MRKMPVRAHQSNRRIEYVEVIFEPAGANGGAAVSLRSPIASETQMHHSMLAPDVGPEAVDRNGWQPADA
jgi:hypothetical protein